MISTAIIFVVMVILTTFYKDWLKYNQEEINDQRYKNELLLEECLTDDWSVL